MESEGGYLLLLRHISVVLPLEAVQRLEDLSRLATRFRVSRTELSLSFSSLLLHLPFSIVRTHSVALFFPLERSSCSHGGSTSSSSLSLSPSLNFQRAGKQTTVEELCLEAAAVIVAARRLTLQCLCDRCDNIDVPQSQKFTDNLLLFYA